MTDINKTHRDGLIEAYELLRQLQSEIKNKNAGLPRPWFGRWRVSPKHHQYAGGSEALCELGWRIAMALNSQTQQNHPSNASGRRYVRIPQ